MAGAITWEQIVGMTTLVGTIIGLVAWVWRTIGTLRERIEEVRAKGAHELSEFKLAVAEQYARNEAIKEVEERVVEAINRLADRLDRILDRQAKPRGSA